MSLCPTYPISIISNLTWRVSAQPVGYENAVKTMQNRLNAIANNQKPSQIWLLQHTNVYTAGTSARIERDLLDSNIQVIQTGRGGQLTYHGPGQEILYAMVDLRILGRDVQCYVRALETWGQAIFAHFGITATPRTGRVGLWVDHNGREEKIAAIGVRLSHWVSMHGMALNINPDLSAFDKIIPCGIDPGQYGVTSLAQMGINVTRPQIHKIIRATCPFG